MSPASPHWHASAAAYLADYHGPHNILALWARFLIGDPDDGGAMTFEEFAAIRLPGVLRFAGVLTADRALAEDVVQDGYTHAGTG